MARFKSEYREVFTLNVPMETAKAHFGSVDRIVENFVELDHADRIDEQTVHYFIKQKSTKGVKFAGRYQVRYEFASDQQFGWKTVGEGNMWSTGKVLFKSKGDKATEIDWWNEIEVDIPVNRILGKVISPIVNMEIRSGSKHHLEKMRKSLPSA